MISLTETDTFWSFFFFIPLSHGELSGHAAGLVLNHIRHKVWTQLYIGPPVTSHIVVIGGREQSEDLREMKEKVLTALQSGIRGHI